MDLNVGNAVLCILKAFGGFRRCVRILIGGLVIDSMELIVRECDGFLFCVHLLDMILFLS